MTQANCKGKLVIVSGPSGVGKSTICSRVVEGLDNAYLSVSVTTRPKAEAELDGREYYFIGRDEFEAKASASELLEHAEVFGNLYGTPKDKVDEALSQGKVVLLEIDVQGGRQVKRLYPEAIMIFVLPPTQRHLVERMNGRARDDEETAKIRLENADDEIAAAFQFYNNMVINDDLEQAVQEVVDIIEQSDGDKE